MGWDVPSLEYPPLEREQTALHGRSTIHYHLLIQADLRGFSRLNCVRNNRGSIFQAHFQSGKSQVHFPWLI